MYRFTSHFTVFLCFYIIFITGCDSDFDLAAINGSDDTARTAKQAAAAWKLDTWKPWKFPVKVCFTSRKALDTDVLPSKADFATLSNLAFTTLTQSWGTVPGVSFTKVMTCPTTGDYLNINIPQGSGGRCGIGAAVPQICDIWGDATSADSRAFFQGTVVHEVGHGLGLHHEHQRNDHPALCSGVQNQLDACNRCKTAADNNKLCLAADWNVCVVPNPLVTTNQVVTVGSKQYQAIVDAFNDNTIDMGIALLTGYDPDSIMNYCSKVTGSRAQNDYMLTQRDWLGMQILYPKSPLAHSLGCKNNCFSMGASNFVVGSGGSFVSDWTALGARNITPVWKLGSSGNTNMLELYQYPTTIVEESTNTLSYSYSDLSNRNHTGMGNVIKSNSLFAGIAQSTTLAMSI